MNLLTQFKSWNALKEHAQQMRVLGACGLTDQNNFNIKIQNIELDYSNQNITNKTIDLLVDLAIECKVPEKIQDLLNGECVNISQNIPALHTALRLPQSSTLEKEGVNIIPEIQAVLEKMKQIANQIRSLAWHGRTGKPIVDIVNIGIGGSDFGPRFCLDALSEYAASNLNYHFISDADPRAFERAVKKLNPETTLFIVSSKSFTTYETLYNFEKARQWIGDSAGLEHHFIAVTANEHAAKKLGFENILPIWDWVGGRYSFCSAINLIACIALGYDVFEQILAGAHNMDEHFAKTPLEQNIPVLLALLGVWNINFLHIPTLLLWVYTQQLALFVPYVQQLDMESNGKSFDINGNSVNYATGPIVWGSIGNQAQHSYYQLICQGTHKVAGDFFSVNEFKHDAINALCEAKIQVLNKGVPCVDSTAGYIPGGMPINHIRLDACIPFILGQLVALYEHKIYVQSIIWNINAFDQPGVDSAKQIQHSCVDVLNSLAVSAN